MSPEAAEQRKIVLHADGCSQEYHLNMQREPTREFAAQALADATDTVLRIVKESGCAVDARFTGSKDSFDITISASPALKLPIEKPRALEIIAERVSRTQQLSSEDEGAQSVDWDRWHHLLDARDSRHLDQDEELEFDLMTEIVAEIDADEEVRARAAMDPLIRQHEQVLASIRQLTDRVELLADKPTSSPRSKGRR